MKNGQNIESKKIKKIYILPREEDPQATVCPQHKTEHLNHSNKNKLHVHTRAYGTNPDPRKIEFFSFLSKKNQNFRIK